MLPESAPGDNDGTELAHLLYPETLHVKRPPRVAMYRAHLAMIEARCTRILTNDRNLNLMEGVAYPTRSETGCIRCHTRATDKGRS